MPCLPCLPCLPWIRAVLPVGPDGYAVSQRLATVGLTLSGRRVRCLRLMGAGFRARPPGAIHPSRCRCSAIFRSTKSAGFGLVELIIGLTIASVLLAVAAPSMKIFVQNNRLRSATLDLANDINFARGEAVKRKVRVVLCRTDNPLAVTPVCGGATRNWTTGWLVFASGVNDANSTYEVASDTLLLIGPPHTGATLAVRTNSAANLNLEYNTDGTTRKSGATARFAICDDRAGAAGRQVNVPPHGRLRIKKGSTAAPLTCTLPS
ncbi:MAG: type IV fimbrial biogenesis protein FimT [Gammaproteobacteria bacterium]|jgi:type IV fimbrial biogenesis protein FimT